MGWSAVTGAFGAPVILLYIGGIFWTLGYDTIYAHQDRRDDEAIGIKSTARLFGKNSKRWVALFYTLALALFNGVDGPCLQSRAGILRALLILAALFALVQVLAWKHG